MPSPFLHGNPVPPDLLVGRRKAIARILDRLAYHGQSCAILGEPRTGKTSLLDYLASPAARDAYLRGDREHVVVSYLDSQTLDYGLHDADFWERAFEPLDAPGSPLPDAAPVREALRVWRAGGSQARRIDAVLASFHASRLRLVLLIDELDYLVHQIVADHRFFFGKMRSAATTSRGALALVFASRRPLAALDEIAQGIGYLGSPYFNFATEEPLGPLGPDEVDTLLARAGGRFSPEDEHLVRLLAAGHPYLVQLAADALWRAHEDLALAAAERHAEASEHALREASRVLADTWRHWSAPQRYVLASVALRHPLVAARFREAVDALLAQGFLHKEGVDLRIGPGLLHTWVLGELLAHASSEDPFRDCIGPEDHLVPLQLPDRQAWVRSVRALAGSADVLPPSRSLHPAEHRCAKLFISYASEDDRHRERLERHLSPLRREGLVTIWHNQRIAPGDDWRARIGAALQESDVVLLLVSADFLASDFCVDVELARAVERHHAGTSRVIPVLVRSADWETPPLASLQVLPRSKKPVVQWEDHDQAWTEVALEIRRVVALRTPRGTERNGSA